MYPVTPVTSNRSRVILYLSFNTSEDVWSDVAMNTGFNGRFKHRADLNISLYCLCRYNRFSFCQLI